jgi:hypothetical protein
MAGMHEWRIGYAILIITNINFIPTANYLFHYYSIIEYILFVCVRGTSDYLVAKLNNIVMLNKFVDHKHKIVWVRVNFFSGYFPLRKKGKYLTIDKHLDDGNKGEKSMSIVIERKSCSREGERRMRLI